MEGRAEHILHDRQHAVDHHVRLQDGVLTVRGSLTCEGLFKNFLEVAQVPFDKIDAIAGNSYFRVIRGAVGDLNGVKSLKLEESVVQFPLHREVEIHLRGFDELRKDTPVAHMTEEGTQPHTVANPFCLKRHLIPVADRGRVIIKKDIAFDGVISLIERPKIIPRTEAIAAREPARFGTVKFPHEGRMSGIDFLEILKLAQPGFHILHHMRVDTPEDFFDFR